MITEKHFTIFIGEEDDPYTDYILDGTSKQRKAINECIDRCRKRYPDKAVSILESTISTYKMYSPYNLNKERVSVDLLEEMNNEDSTIIRDDGGINDRHSL